MLILCGNVSQYCFHLGNLSCAFRVNWYAIWWWWYNYFFRHIELLRIEKLIQEKESVTELHKNIHSVLIVKPSSSWNEAFDHCKQIGGSLMKLATYERWSQLQDSVTFSNENVYYNFWLSDISFIGKVDGFDLNVSTLLHVEYH